MARLFAILVILLGAGAAFAQDDAYTISGVRIDATASSAAAAQQQAIRAGAPRALQRLFERLTLPADHGRLPQIDAGTASNLAIGFSMDNEARGAQRYRADLTVSFDPNGVRRLLRNYGVPFVETPAPPTLILPVYEVGGQASLWNANPWAEGWDEARYIGGFAPVVLPSGFGGRVGLISPSAAASGDPQAMAVLADSYGVDRVLQAVARPEGDRLNVDLTLWRMTNEPDFNALGGSDGLRADAGGFGADAVLSGEAGLDGPGAPQEPASASRLEPEAEDLGTVTVTAAEGADVDNPFQLAADRAHERLAEDWKERTIIRSRERTEVQVTVLYDSIGEWHEVRDTLGASPFVTDARLDALSADGALMTVTYRGLRDQLVADLLRRDVQFRTDPQLGDVAYAAGRLSQGVLGFDELGTGDFETDGFGAGSGVPAGSQAPASALPGAL